MPRYLKHPVVTPDQVMARIIECARNGERAPLSSPATFPTKVTSELARAGRIKIEVYPHNWRVITVTAGEHAGLSTLGPPNPTWRPYLTLPETTEAI